MSDKQLDYYGDMFVKRGYQKSYGMTFAYFLTLVERDMLEGVMRI